MYPSPANAHNAPIAQPLGSGAVVDSSVKGQPSDSQDVSEVEETLATQDVIAADGPLFVRSAPPRGPSSPG